MKIPNIFNSAEIARHLYPNNKSAKSHLFNKINCKHGQRINENDKKRISEFIKYETSKFLKDLEV